VPGAFSNPGLVERWDAIRTRLVAMLTFTIGLCNLKAKQWENVTLTRISMLHGVGNCRGVDNGVTLKSA
jgi:hypothetical protein